MNLVATESEARKKRRKRSEEMVKGFETAMFFQAFEENLTGILNNVRSIKEGTLTEAYVEEATYRRYLDARETLRQMATQIETFQTMLQIVEYDLLETAGT
jgi:hypothetical protein